MTFLNGLRLPIYNNNCLRSGVFEKLKSFSSCKDSTFDREESSESGGSLDEVTSSSQDVSDYSLGASCSTTPDDERQQRLLEDNSRNCVNSKFSNMSIEANSCSTYNEIAPQSSSITEQNQQFTAKEENKSCDAPVNQIKYLTERPCYLRLEEPTYNGKLSSNTSTEPVYNDKYPGGDTILSSPNTASLSRTSVSSSQKEHLKLVTAQLSNCRKLFELCNKMSEQSQSEILMSLYEDLVSRVQTIFNVDFPFMQNELSVRFYTVEEEAGLSCEPKTSIQHQMKSEKTPELCENGKLRISKRAVGSLRDTTIKKTLLVQPQLLGKYEMHSSSGNDVWNPSSVSFLSNDSVIVAQHDNMEEKNNRLNVFDLNGSQKKSIAQGVVQPLGVATTQTGHLVVTCCKSKRVKLMTSEGQLVSEIGKGQLGWPYGVVVNSRNQIIVTDVFNDTVSIYTMDGRKVKSLGSTASPNCQFRNPYHVTVDSRDNIIVSDSGNNCVKVLDHSSFKTLFSISSTQHCTPEFQFLPSKTRNSSVKSSHSFINPSLFTRLRDPRGIAVDPSGNILVADGSGRICVFDSNGLYVRNLFADFEMVKFPEALSCNPAGTFVVTELNTNSVCAVKMFNLYA